MGAIDAHGRCPVCGFNLGYRAWDGETASDELCPCCLIQFGYDDATGGNVAARRILYAKWRSEWVAAGMPWRSHGGGPPQEWNPMSQLNQLFNGN